jgi:hypothetical protein
VCDEVILELQRTLQSAGVDRRYVRRLSVELDDHLRDLYDREMARHGNSGAARQEAVARLTDGVDLADEVLRRAYATPLARRHPWLVFALLPLVALAFAKIAVALTFQASLLLAGAAPTSTSVDVAVVVLHWLPPILVGMWICAVARRSVCAAIWPILACLVVAIPAGTNVVRFHGAVMELGGVSFGVGPADVQVTAHLLLPLIVFGLWWLLECLAGRAPALTD